MSSLRVPDHWQRFVVSADRGHIDEHPAPGLAGFEPPDFRARPIASVSSGHSEFVERFAT
jgi:hypothetical protein